MPRRGPQPDAESTPESPPGSASPTELPGSPALPGRSGPPIDARVSRILRTDYLAFYLLLFALVVSCLVLLAFGVLHGLRGGVWPGDEGAVRSWPEVLWMGLGAALLHVAVTLPVVAWRVHRWRRVLLRGRAVGGVLEAVRRRGRDAVAVRFRYRAGDRERTRTLMVRAVPELARLSIDDHRVLVLPGKPRRALPAGLFLPRPGGPETALDPGRQPPGTQEEPP